jgi:hypothetical protein
VGYEDAASVLLDAMTGIFSLVLVIMRQMLRLDRSKQKNQRDFSDGMRRGQ